MLPLRDADFGVSSRVLLGPLDDLCRLVEAGSIVELDRWDPSAAGHGLDLAALWLQR